MALRPLLRALLRAPGALYNPVYIGPLRRLEPLRLEVAACLEERERHRRTAPPGTRKHTPRLVEPATYPEQADPGPAVVVASEREASLLLRGGAKLREDTQLIVWGAEHATELSPFLQARLQDGGLALDPTEHRGLVVGWSMGAVLARTLESAGAASNPVVILGSPALSTVLASEARLRLELAGCAPVRVFAPDQMPEARSSPRRAGTTGAVLRLGALADPAARERVLATAEVLLGDGSLVVLVVDGDQFPHLEADPAWRRFAARAGMVRALEDGEPDDAPWPLATRLLLGAPPRAQEVAQTLSFHLDAVPLEELLQLAAVWGRSGHFVLYSEQRMGWIEVRGDLVSQALRLGDPDALASPEVITGRVRSMAAWGSGQVVFVPAAERAGGGSRRSGIPLEVLVFELTRLADERRAGRAPPADPRVPELCPLKPHQVAAALLRWGLGSAATALLQRAERLSGWGVEEDLLLAHLAAERDPQEAVARLRHGVFRLASEETGSAVRSALQIDATLNALLLEVRGGQARAAAAWAMVERWLEAGGEDWLSTERHAAILFELATRARESEAAERCWKLLVRRAGEDHPLVRSLVVHRPAPRRLS